MSDARERLEPVAWRYRYLHEGKRNHWIVRQSPAYSSEPTEQWVGIEAEPLYAEADLRTVLDALSIDETKSLTTARRITADVGPFDEDQRAEIVAGKTDGTAKLSGYMIEAVRRALLERGRNTR